MTVRTITRKVYDIAEAAWSYGDGAAREDDDYGCVGPDADRRADRMIAQVRELAKVAILGRYQLGADGIIELETHPRLEIILASALIGDWTEVEKALSNAIAGARATDE